MRNRGSLEVHLVTGGCGYPGYHLGKKLVENGHQVIIFDLIQLQWPLLDGMTVIQGSITNFDEVDEAFKGVNCVYHMASYGMSGREQLNKKLIEAVNIGGTENVIKACMKNKITRLVYTSTYNVIFGGQEIKDGDDSLPYLPLNQHPDHYSRTKSIAEKKVLTASGTGGLCTCALRLAGVYGPGEKRHIPRTLGYVEQGLMIMTYGGGTLQDFLHVDNLVQGHILAGQALSADRECIAGGQAYFLSDGAPVNTFEFFRPLFEGLGYKMPKMTLPVSVVYFIAFLTEWIHYFVARVYNFQPLLTRTEVFKTGVTHYFSIEKARKQLGYNPTKQNDISEVLKYYLDSGHHKIRKEKSAFSDFLWNVILFCIFVCLIMSFLPSVK